VVNYDIPDFYNPGGFLAEIASNPLISGNLLSSNSWDVALIRDNLTPPTDLSTLTWTSATEYGANDSPTIWYSQMFSNPISGISGSAKWIWWGENYADPGAPDGEDSVYIRTTITIAPVPEPCPDDTLPPTGSVHAYPNLIWPPNNKLVKLCIVGYVKDEMSIARDEGGAGVSSAHLLINGKDIVPLSLETDGRFNAELEVLATKGATYIIELYATDTKPQESGGPNSGLVDSTYIIVPHDTTK
jgi:hypothetical protein